MFHNLLICYRISMVRYCDTAMHSNSYSIPYNNRPKGTPHFNLTFSVLVSEMKVCQSQQKWAWVLNILDLDIGFSILRYLLWYEVSPVVQYTYLLFFCKSGNSQIHPRGVALPKHNDAGLTNQNPTPPLDPWSAQTCFYIPCRIGLLWLTSYYTYSYWMEVCVFMLLRYLI